MDFADCFRTGEVQQVVAAFEELLARGELLAPVVGFVQAVLLYHRTESAVEQQDAVFEFMSYVAVFYWGMISISKSLLHLLPVTKIRSEAAS